MAKSKYPRSCDLLSKSVSTYLTKKSKRKSAVATLKKMADKLASAASGHEAAWNAAEKECLKVVEEYSAKTAKIIELEKKIKAAKGGDCKDLEKELKGLEKECEVLSKRGSDAYFALQDSMTPVFFAAGNVQNGCQELLDTQ